MQQTDYIKTNSNSLAYLKNRYVVQTGSANARETV